MRNVNEVLVSVEVLDSLLREPSQPHTWYRVTKGVPPEAKLINMRWDDNQTIALVFDRAVDDMVLLESHFHPPVDVEAALARRLPPPRQPQPMD